MAFILEYPSLRDANTGEQMRTHWQNSDVSDPSPSLKDKELKGSKNLQIKLVS